MSELKPCPFCGEEISFDYEVNNFRCVGCGTTIPYSPNGETVNTRPIEDELRAEIEKRTAELHYANTACMEMKHELARRDASLLTEGEQKEILSYIRGNYDRDKIPTWLLDLIDELARRDEELALTEKKLCNIDRSARAEVARRDEIIARLKEDGERLGNTLVSNGYCCHLHNQWLEMQTDTDSHTPHCPITLHRALMKELE